MRVIPASDVNVIVYEGGSVEVINAQQTREKVKREFDIKQEWRIDLGEFVNFKRKNLQFDG